MYGRDNFLFYEGDLDATLTNHFGQISAKVDAISRDQLFGTPEDDLVEHVSAQIAIEPITFHETSAEMEEKEAKIDVSQDRERNPFRDSGPIYVSGIRVTVSIPYTGDPSLWKQRPNSYQLSFPRGEVRMPNKDGIGHLDIVIEQPTDAPPERIKQRLESELKSIRFFLDSQKRQVEQFNNSVPGMIRSAIQARRNRLKKHEGIVELLGIPLKRRGDAPQIDPIPIKRRLVKPLPAPPKSGFKPEPGIADQDYEHILSVIRHVGRTFEAMPRTYGVHGEEELRDIILANLNGLYEGGATGETFRLSGKTDICIEDQNRAAFVAECKMWQGPKELLNAVDQLLGYLTWRDCKTAIIIFNKRTAKFTEILEKVPVTLQSHPKFKRDLGQRGAGEWRFVFTSKEDESRQVVVNVFAFNLYSDPRERP